jgi:transketolase
MRNKFAELLTELAKRDEEICLLYADIGNRLFDKLKTIAPKRTINAGISEANMATMASGMANMGFKPFIYTITPFTTARNFEQIKIDIAYANMPVVIVGTGSGLAYANLGPTHHSFEDIALMRVLPNMRVICPADAFELEALMPAIMENPAPTYLRIGKKNEPLNYTQKPVLTIGKAHILEEGEQVALVCTGTALNIGKNAHQILQTKGIKCELVSMHTVKPLDEDYLQTLGRFALVVSIEEHSKIGGLGAAISDYLCEINHSLNLRRFGIPDEFIDQVDSPESAREKIGLTAEIISNKVIDWMSK